MIPVSKGDEGKISQSISKMAEEDYTIRFENDAETKQLLIYGLGDVHLSVLSARLKSRFGLNVRFDTPKLAYREKITKSVDVEGKHKKQNGGSGQYGHVKMRFAPGEGEGLTFTVSVVGGTVPKNFNPAVEKGIQEAILRGPLAGYPMVGLKAVLYDGSYHPVDSNEMAFKEAMPNAMPTLLEPVGSLAVTIPDSYMGDVIGDLNKRRGRIMGMTPNEHGEQIVEAEVPMAEMMRYAIDLRAMTQSRGSFTFNFVRYEDCPPDAQKKAIAEAKALQEE